MLATMSFIGAEPWPTTLPGGRRIPEYSGVLGVRRSLREGNE